MSRKYSLVDLFAGAGGLSLGFAQTGQLKSFYHDLGLFGVFFHLLYVFETLPSENLMILNPFTVLLVF